MTYGEILLAVGLLVGATILFMAVVGFGFFLGRKTIIPYAPQQPEQYDPGEPGIHEYDPYAVALGDRDDIKDLK